jgi:DNA polymerase
MRRPEDAFPDLYRRLTSDGYRSEDVAKAVETTNRIVMLERLRRYVLQCTDCRFHQTCHYRVPGVGNSSSRFMIVGEGPGEDEDAWGQPLVGISGTLLSLILEKLGVAREQLYITNVMKCRVVDDAGRNKTPTSEETQPCRKFLHREFAYIRPYVVLALGKVAMQHFFPEQRSISAVRGKALAYEGAFVIPTWHPSYILRQTGEELQRAKREAWNDFQQAFRLYRQLRQKDENRGETR